MNVFSVGHPDAQPAGIGAVRQPFPEGLLKLRDVVCTKIEGIGEIRKTVIGEPDRYLPPAYDKESA